MKQNLNYFIAERAEHLAIVHLTRSPNLAIKHLKGADSGLDLLVTILQDQLPTGRMFGVQVKGYDRTFENIQQLSSVLGETEKIYPQELPFPVCLFVFTMDDDKGYYQWLNYLNNSSTTALNFQWRSLDASSVEQILKEVNAWYEAKRHSAA